MNKPKHLARPPKPFLFFSYYNLAQIWFFLFGIPENCFGSIDVTSDCNLRCRHCYFFEQHHLPELPPEGWKARLDRMKAEGYRLYQCAWVGGEPLLRKQVIEM